MKLVGVCGSPRKGATEEAMRHAMAVAGAAGANTELLLLREHPFQPCVHCDACIKKESLGCLRFKDDIDVAINTFIHADAVLVASPVYVMGATPLLAAFFSRMRWHYNLTKENPDVFSQIVGAAMAVGGVRNGGQELTIAAILAALGSKGMMLVTGGRGIYEGVSIWSKNEKEGLQTVDPEAMERLEYLTKKLVAAAGLMRGKSQ